MALAPQRGKQIADTFVSDYVGTMTSLHETNSTLSWAFLVRPQTVPGAQDFATFSRVVPKPSRNPSRRLLPR